jgi:hypothetical protein
MKKHSQNAKELDTLGQETLKCGPLIISYMG